MEIVYGDKMKFIKIYSLQILFGIAVIITELRQDDLMCWFAIPLGLLTAYNSLVEILE